jgi:hypothetical protein
MRRLDFQIIAQACRYDAILEPVARRGRWPTDRAWVNLHADFAHAPQTKQHAVHALRNESSLNMAFRAA